MQRAKVKFILVPAVVIQVGSPDGERGFAAEEQYMFLKSGFKGIVNRIHEDGPFDSCEMDTVDYDAVASSLIAAFKEGDDNMVASRRVKLMELFKNMSSQDINHLFEIDESNNG
jgi:hypothetical protein